VLVLVGLNAMLVASRWCTGYLCCTLQQLLLHCLLWAWCFMLVCIVWLGSSNCQCHSAAYVLMHWPNAAE
jgi:hypothetical protein